MDELAELVICAKGGDHAAYEVIVRRFQDMAVGYGYAALGSLQLAEDAAQEAFINAYNDLPALREPAAFPGWFRRIVLKQVDRIRRRRHPSIRVDQMPELTSRRPGPAEVAEAHEVRYQVSQAIEALPEHQRVAVALYYMDGYSQGEISSFLDIPLGTVKSRLHAARGRLKERMVAMIQERLPDQRPSKDDAFSQKVMRLFEHLIGSFGDHEVRGATEIYNQPYVYLSLHLVQMQAAGWTEVDFDQIAAVSGASALFAYQPGEFRPKYAHLHIDLDQRIAEATGFGYEWVDFQNAEAAWDLLKESVDAGRPVKGVHWENILFSDYRDAPQTQGRQVFAMADGPDTFAKWWSWSEFTEWVELVKRWRQTQLGRHTASVDTRPAGEIALRVLKDLVEWSTEPPETVRGGFPEGARRLAGSFQEGFPKATFGLAGIEAYADECERSDLSEDWVACHDINPQWTIRNATGVYLRRVAEADLFPAQVNGHLMAAAMQYRAAFEGWQAFYNLLGHKAAGHVRAMRARRLAGAAVVRAWLEHERTALSEIEQALAALG